MNQETDMKGIKLVHQLNRCITKSEEKKEVEGLLSIVHNSVYVLTIFCLVMFSSTLTLDCYTIHYTLLLITFKQFEYFGTTFKKDVVYAFQYLL